MAQHSSTKILIFVSLILQGHTAQERLIPSITLVLPQNDFGRESVTIDTECSSVAIQRNTTRILRGCRGNNSILNDGIEGVFNLTDGLQANELQQVYVWNVSKTPEDPFVLYFFSSPVRVTTILINFILLENYMVLEIPSITMFASNTTRELPQQRLNLIYDASTAPDTGVYQAKIKPVNDDSYRTWCIDMTAQQGTEWIIVSEIELYQEDVTTSFPSPATTMAAETSVDKESTLMILTTAVQELSTAVILMGTTASSRTHANLTPSPSITLSYETMTNLPTILPSISSTPPTGMEPISSSQTVFRFLQPQENPYILQVSPNQQSINLNCMAFYNGSNNITINWKRNGRVIFNNTEQYTEMNIVSTILKINGQSLGRYTCIFIYSSGESVRELQIISSESDSEENKNVAKDFPVVTVSAVVGGAVLLFIFLTAICLTVIFCRHRHRQKSDNATTKANNLMVDAFAGLPKLQVNSLYSRPTMTEDGHNDTFHSYVNDLNIHELHDYVTSHTYSIPNNENIYQESIDPNLLMTASQKIDNCEDGRNTLHPYTSKYATPARPLTKSEAPVSVTWSNILPVKRLGAGQFGEVILAITMDLSPKDLRLSDDDCKTNQTLVAVKVLKGDENDIKKDFEDEIKFMARLNHENVVKVLGICSEGDPFIMMEYMENGDLNSYLKQFTYAKKARCENELDLAILLYIGLQVVNGMKYLASCQFVHRDLAARNCLVGKDYVVKIADFGMSQNLYSSHYFVVKGAAILPIRWMATESFYGKFSIKTDVWSCGVTLWEILTLCQVKPYSELNDHQLIIDILLGPSRKHLPKPENCPDKLYEILQRCFVHDASERADFDELYNSLYSLYSELQET